MPTLHETTPLEVRRGAEITEHELKLTRDAMRRYRADGDALDAQVDDLLAKHGEIWVAVYDGQLFSGSSAASVHDKLRAAKIAPGEAFVQYLSDKPVFHVHYGG
jgi:hypothetical protein